MDELIKLLNEVKEDVEFETCTELINGGYLDSFDIIQIINSLSEEYDITIPASEIVPENFNSAEAIWNMVQRLQEE